METNQNLRRWLTAAGIVAFFLVATILINSKVVNGEIMQWALIIFIGVLFVFGLAYNAWAGKRRREALQQFALENSLEYQAEDKIYTQQLTQGSTFELFKRGHSKKARNLLRGQRLEKSLVVFDYQYTVGGGRSSQTHVQTTALLGLERAEIPAFWLRPRGFFSKMMKKLGKAEIEFPQRPEFGEHYQLSSGDEQAAHKLITDTVITFLEGHPKLSVESAANQLLIYRENEKVSPVNMRSFIDEANQFADLFIRPTFEMELYDFGIKK